MSKTSSDNSNRANVLSREDKLLKLMIGHHCFVETCSDKAAVILNFEGHRRVKCGIETIQKWLASEQAMVHTEKNKTRISVSEIGKKRLLTAALNDYAGQHRNLQFETILVGGETQTVTRNYNESPLARLFKPNSKGTGRWLDTGEFSAGERLRSDFEYSQLGPKISASWDPTAQISSGKSGRRPTESLTDRVIGARVRLNKAIDAVGPELSGVLLDVCCFLKGLEQVEVERRWPRRSAKLILKIGLSVLARHYTPVDKRNQHNIKHWGANDYRPNMERPS